MTSRTQVGEYTGNSLARGTFSRDRRDTQALCYSSVQMACDLTNIQYDAEQHQHTKGTQH